ncbi:endonuclease III domain-containing protein [Amphibacillus sediminis]|uniref:endonuclease III domain-containing protein n=1 Tax=Amphibacillus sediminis TaxID=360185 RepID=UPI00082BC61A|nr:endonuclease III domain-containing protein [Amphibacillus sediminis]
MDKLITNVFQRLYQYYGPQNWWPARTSFEMMIGAILVQNTAWTNVEKAMSKLQPYLTATQLETLSDQQLQLLIKPSGFFRIKTQRIRAFLAWYKKYNYQLEQLAEIGTESLRNQMLNIKGIGPETADSILLYACQRPVFVVDAYIKRIYYRLGVDLPKSYQLIQQFFEEKLPSDVLLYNEYHALIVQHAKQHCKSKPICPTCPLVSLCPQRLN